MNLEIGPITEHKSTPYLSVIIPAYNEANRLPDTLKTVLAYCQNQPYQAEILVVDDGSTDDTVKLAQKIAQTQPQLQVIENAHRGKGYTVRTGMLAGQGEYLLFSDADLAVPIEELEKILPHFENGCDVVIGSREGQGARRIGEPIYRHIMGRVFNFIVRLVTLGGFQDTQCGFKAFRREVARDLFERSLLYGEDSAEIIGPAVTSFDVEILFLAVKRGYKVKEVPIKWIYGTETKVNPITDSWRNFKDVVRVRWFDISGKYDLS